MKKTILALLFSVTLPLWAVEAPAPDDRVANLEAALPPEILALRDDARDTSLTYEEALVVWALQATSAELVTLTAERDALRAEMLVLRAEVTDLKGRLVAAEAERDKAVKLNADILKLFQPAQP